MRQRISNEKGFTLIEAILAAVILGTGLTASLFIFGQANQHSLDGDQKTVGTQLAGELLEKIIADKTYYGLDHIVAANYPPDQMQAPYAGFNRHVLIEDVDADLITTKPGSGIRKVTVFAGWGAGDNQSTSVSTILTSH